MDELLTIEHKDTYEIVINDEPAIPTKVILKVKRNSKGEIIEFKARLVVLGNVEKRFKMKLSQMK